MVLDKETLDLFLTPADTTDWQGRTQEGTNSLMEIHLLQLIKTANRLEDLAFNVIHENESEQIKYISLYIKCLGLISQMTNGRHYSYNIEKTEKLNRLGVEDLNPAQARNDLLKRLDNFTDVVEDAEILEREKFIKE